MSAGSTGDDKQLAMAYAVCRGIARAQAKNFYYAFLILPKPKRDALCAIYAFMRHADDISDGPGLSAAERQQSLGQWSVALREASAGKRSDDPVILATADAQQRYRIPGELFEQLIYGTASDLDAGVRYQTFEELYQYCYYVAGVVGLVCLHVFGFEEERARAMAEKTGIAFQLTNIIRDVKEDASMGRVYVPEEDLRRFGHGRDDLHTALNGAPAPGRFRELLAFEAERARQYYQAADELLPLIHEDSRPALWALVEIYRRLLAKIAAADYDVFSRRVSLTVPEKLGVLFRGLLKAVV